MHDDDTDLEAALLAYLGEHPDAMDSLPGIAEWWVTRHRVRVETERVARVLRRLVERAVLEQVGCGDAALYRLRAGRGGGAA